MTVYNLKNRKKEDYTTVYTLTADKTLTIDISEDAAVSVEVLWGGFTYNGSSYGTNLSHTDGTATLKISADGENTQNHPTMSAITMNAATGSGGWQTDKWKDKYLHVALTKGSNTAGTVRILVTTKDND